MNRVRNFLTVLFLLGLSAIALAAAVQAISLGIPETLASNASVLIAALANEDVSEETRPAKLKLGQRVQRELHENLDWPTELAALDTAQRERLVDNVAELARESIDVRVEEFARLPDRRRNRFLDNQFDDIKRWAMIIDRATRTEGQPLIGIAALIQLQGQMNQWYRDSTPEHRKNLEQFLKAVQSRASEQFKRNMRLN